MILVDDGLLGQGGSARWGDGGGHPPSSAAAAEALLEEYGGGAGPPTPPPAQSDAVGAREAARPPALQL